jgi:hypothetical protein
MPPPSAEFAESSLFPWSLKFHKYIKIKGLPVTNLPASGIGNFRELKRPDAYTEPKDMAGARSISALHWRPSLLNQPFLTLTVSEGAC